LTQRICVTRLAFFLLSTCHVCGGEPACTPDLSRDRVVYEVAYAHLDTQWRWSYPQVIRQFLPDTMWDNFYLLERYPHYVFNFTGANRYRMMKEYWPESYQHLRQYISAGRWYPAGASWEENDVLIPSTESLIRQILFGQRFFEREFGIQNNEYFLPDCFGFPASLPSVLAHCGLRGFVTQKLTWHSANGIPFNIGLWEGPDGQSVVSVLNPGPYDGVIEEDPSLNVTNLNRIEFNRKQSGLSAEYRLYGTGDRGGAPKEDSVRWVEKAVGSTGAVRVVSAKADQFFADISEDQRARLPKYKGDLLLVEHSAGSLTSQAYIKRWNQRNECLADAAEKAAVAAHLLGATPYPHNKLNRAWELVLGAQFHDILSGTSHPRSYEYSWNDQVIAMNSFSAVLQNSVGAVARALDTRTDGLPLVVYNPLSIEREDVVELETELEFSAAQVCRADGTPVPTQVLPSNGAKVRLLFLARVPSIGFAVYAVKPGNSVAQVGPSASSGEVGTPGGLRASERSIENSQYKVTLNDSGDIASIFDKTSSRELLRAPARLAFLNEKPSSYPAWNMDWKDRTNPPRSHVTGEAKIQVVENGPVRVAIQVERRSEGSTFTQTIRLAAGDPGNRLEVLNQVDWQSSGCCLKAEFPVSISNRLATYNWGLGKVQRGNNEPRKYEVPSHRWIDLTDSQGSYGVSILTDSKYGSDKPDDSTLRLTLLYSPETTDRFAEQRYQDWGRHEFVYAIAGHPGDWRAAKTDWQAFRLSQPLLAFRTVAHSGPLGPRFSLLRTESDRVAVQAVKVAEDNDQVIIRLQELTGEPATVAVAVPNLKTVSEVNGIERSPTPLGSEKERISLTFHPFQLRTLACELATPLRLSPPTSTPVALPYDLDVFSYPDLRQDGYCDRGGNSIPGEMIDDTIVSEGISFRIGPRATAQRNAVACGGQAILLPQGDFNRLHLLALAVNGDAEGDFAIGQQVTHLKIQDWSGFIGSWDNRIFAGPIDSASFSINLPLDRLAPAFIKRDPLAWFSSHRHQRDGTDQPYTYCYIFKYSLPLSPSSKALTLPDNPRIRIIAITAAHDENDLTRPLQPLYDDFTNRKPLDLVQNQRPR
jgi:alpha-mannosidase